MSLTLKGWLQLHRSLLTSQNWNISHKCNSFVIYLMCRANHSEGIWLNPCTGAPEKIPKGSFVSSLANMAKESHLSIKEVRTCLKRLGSNGTNFLAQKGAQRFTQITVVKFEFWQKREKKWHDIGQQYNKGNNETKDLKVFFNKKREERESKPRSTDGGLMPLRDVLKKIMGEK